jgi:hypothetical protein
MSAIAEKYARAIRSSHLETGRWFEPGDLDAIIAAGYVSDGIGTDLIRLRSERDSISRLPGARLAFPLLKSMARTRERITRYAAQESGYPEDAPELIAIIGKVLDLFLDPMCPPCGGTGKVGAYGSAMPMCPTCRGSTKRDVTWPSDEAEQFAGWLQSQMESKVDAALRKMSRLLRD